jgi:hypothetical protein
MARCSQGTPGVHTSTSIAAWSWIFLVLAAAAPAAAEGVAAPIAAPVKAAPGLTLREGQISLAVNLEVEMTADKGAQPLSIAPDVAVGVTDDLTLALVHSKFATTGFRAAVGGGLCVTGTDDGCAHAYDNVGLEGWYAVTRGRLAVAAGGGLHALRLDDGWYALKVGLKVRATAAGGKLAVSALPSVLVAVSERDPMAPAKPNKDRLWIPVSAMYKLTGKIAAGLGTGLKGPISGFGDAWEVPLGVLGQVTVDPRITVGASWVFGAMIGGATNPDAPLPPLKGPDLRGLQVWVSYLR